MDCPWHLSRVCQIHTCCFDFRGASMQWSSTLYLAKHLLCFAPCSQSPHHGITSYMPLNLQTSKHPGETFVDDTNLWLTSTNPFSSLTLIPSMQKVAQLWERLLFASGGALAIQKCFYFLVDWYWDHTGFAVLSSNLASPGPQLVMTSGRSTIFTPING